MTRRTKIEENPAEPDIKETEPDHTPPHGRAKGNLPLAGNPRMTISESFLMQAQKIAKLGLWRWSVETHSLTEWSEEYAEIMGVAHGDLDPSDEAGNAQIHPDDRRRILDAYDNASAEQSDFHLSYRIVRPDGEIRHIREIGEPEFDDQGRHVAYFGTIQDVTDQKLAEQALLDRESLLGQAQRQAQLGHWRWSAADGKISYFSTEARRISEKWLDYEANTNAEMYQNAHPDDRERIIREKDASEVEQRDFDMEYRAVLPDGEVKYIRETGTAEFDDRGRFTGHFGTIQDITDLRATEESLRRSEARFADFAEAASDWLWEMDADLRFSYFSVDFDNRIGAKTESWLGMKRWELPGVDLEYPGWQTHIDTVESHLPFRDSEFSVVNKEGRRHYVRISGKPIFGEDESFLGYRGIATDITEEKRGQHAMETLQQRFMDALDNTSEGISLWDAEDRLVLFNENYRQRMEAAVPGLLRAGISFEKFLREGTHRSLRQVGGRIFPCWSIFGLASFQMAGKRGTVSHVRSLQGHRDSGRRCRTGKGRRKLRNLGHRTRAGLRRHYRNRGKSDGLQGLLYRLFR